MATRTPYGRPIFHSPPAYAPMVSLATNVKMESQERRQDDRLSSGTQFTPTVDHGNTLCMTNRNVGQQEPANFVGRRFVRAPLPGGMEHQVPKYILPALPQYALKTTPVPKQYH